MLAIVAIFGACAVAAADVFHLESGGTVSGDLVDTTDGQYRIRCTVGIIRIPVDSVVSIEQAETPFAEYQHRRDETPDTPAALVELAAWCHEQGLRVEWRQHLERAVELDPACEPARRALGFVRVGDQWVDGRRVRKPVARAATKPRGDDSENLENLAEAVRRQWYRHIRAVQRTFLDSDRPDRLEDGIERIRKIRDPLAIGPLTELLGRGPEDQRDLLVEMLATFNTDEATMSLVLIALLDGAESIRARAITELVRRRDPRVEAHLREALHTDNKLVLSRAAHTLGRLRSKAAVPDLIDLLTAEKLAWVQVPVRVYFSGMTSTWRASATPGQAAKLRPERRWAGLWPDSANDPPTVWLHYIDNVWRYRNVTVYRTEVLEALRTITGQDFGFERDAWLNWHRENVPPEE